MMLSIYFHDMTNRKKITRFLMMNEFVENEFDK